MSQKIERRKKQSPLHIIYMTAGVCLPHCRWVSNQCHFPLAWQVSFSIAYNAGGLLVTNCPNFRLPENVFILHTFLKDILLLDGQIFLSVF